MHFSQMEAVHFGERERVALVRLPLVGKERTEGGSQPARHPASTRTAADRRRRRSMVCPSLQRVL